MMGEWAWQWSGMMVMFIAVAVACLPLEMTGRVSRHSFAGRLRGILFWGIWFGVLMLLRHGLGRLGIRPLLEFDLATLGGSFGAVFHAALAIALALIPAFIFDGCYYWFHRLQHRVPLLWRFHAVHHSIEELNAANCYHHWSEGMVRLPLIYLPLALLLNLKVPEVVVIVVMTSIWGQFVHADAPVTFGVIGKIFVSPHYHRVHHSLDKRHIDRNFAGMFPIFDWIFGTAYFPKMDEAIGTGLSNLHEARTPREYLIALRAKT
jgi:sterol desaturase/sphingolipid hydroxylase (fatty acid hydroxylase superfamily)